MAFMVHANRIDDKTHIPGFAFGERSPLAEEFIKLMGINKTTLRKVYTENQLKEFRKISVNIITSINDRRLVKTFLTDCIDSANGSNIDIMFH